MAILTYVKLKPSLRAGALFLCSFSADDYALRSYCGNIFWLSVFLSASSALSCAFVASNSGRSASYSRRNSGSSNLSVRNSPNDFMFITPACLKNLLCTVSPSLIPPLACEVSSLKIHSSNMHFLLPRKNITPAQHFPPIAPATGIFRRPCIPNTAFATPCQILRASLPRPLSSPAFLRFVTR